MQLLKIGYDIDTHPIVWTYAIFKNLCGIEYYPK